MRAAAKGKQPKGYVGTPGASNVTFHQSAYLTQCPSLSHPTSQATEESITATDHLEWLQELIQRSGEPVYTLTRLRNVGVLVGATVLGRFLLRLFRGVLF
jgi:hypothetical protein